MLPGVVRLACWAQRAFISFFILLVDVVSDSNCNLRDVRELKLKMKSTSMGTKLAKV